MVVVRWTACDIVIAASVCTQGVHERIQQLIHDKVMVLPIWQLALIQAYGPNVAESGLGLVADFPWSAPYEDVKLKAR